MRTLSKALLSATVIGIALSIHACAAGVSTGVFVGVAVPGPYVGYPGMGYPGYIGRPPYVYEEDAMNVPAGWRENVALGTAPVTEFDPGCRMEVRGDVVCPAGEREASKSETIDEALPRFGRVDPDTR